ncbi:hypothetical protein GJ699_15990 [Duganella sp. FT80W]|uniref:Uncharacterized protein n=1 Tax=Duganella guangzhouensis TaxID=2666084 RepID=A0A6I2L3R6_9BURK|nr:hypothetical protein [Duganella guangzhouensis]MRW91494.1 hypothetical protein [Duganella guangzhouensis]
MKKSLWMLMLLVCPLLAAAQVVQVKGVGTVTYTSTPTPELKESAYVKAQMAAIEHYFDERGEAEMQNFAAVQDKIQENIEKYISNTVVINEQDQTSLRKYSVAIRGDLSLTKLNILLRSASNVSKAAHGEKSQLVYLFVGREAASVRSFEARVLKRVEAEATNSGSAKGTQRAALQVESGGSSQQKADEVNFRLLPLTNASTAISSQFSQGGFEATDSSFVISDSDFKTASKDFSAGNDLAPATQRAVVATLRKNRVPFFVTATLDVGAVDKDPVSGLARVAVTVTARVLDLRGNFPREVASVPAVQLYGVAPDNAMARDKGLKDAATLATREVISRLNAAGVQ